MDCLNPECAVVYPMFGYCEECSMERLEAKYGFKKAEEIVMVIFGR
jgi:hypothetical protein